LCTSLAIVPAFVEVDPGLDAALFERVERCHSGCAAGN
jgi:hypothetical protein